MKKILLFLMLFSLLTSCTKYGFVSIESPKGEKFYFRIEGRGIDYDSLSLSKNSDYCSKPNPNDSLILFGGHSGYFLYKFEGENLHLYLTSDYKVPPKLSGKTKIILHTLSNIEYIKLSDNYKEKGINKVDIPINEDLYCFRDWLN